MSLFSEFILVASAIVSAITLVLIYRELQKISAAATSSGAQMLNAGGPLNFSGSRQISKSGSASPAGHAFFIFNQGKWRLEEDYSRPGFEATPPAIPGRYGGQVIRTESSLAHGLD